MVQNLYFHRLQCTISTFKAVFEFIICTTSTIIRTQYFRKSHCDAAYVGEGWTSTSLEMLNIDAYVMSLRIYHYYVYRKLQYMQFPICHKECFDGKQCWCRSKHTHCATSEPTQLHEESYNTIHYGLTMGHS